MVGLVRALTESTTPSSMDRTGPSDDKEWQSISVIVFGS